MPPLFSEAAFILYSYLGSRLSSRCRKPHFVNAHGLQARGNAIGVQPLCFPSNFFHVQKALLFFCRGYYISPLVGVLGASTQGESAVGAVKPKRTKEMGSSNDIKIPVHSPLPAICSSLLIAIDLEWTRQVTVSVT
jgi:hypothetical protein